MLGILLQRFRNAATQTLHEQPALPSFISIFLWHCGQRRLDRRFSPERLYPQSSLGQTSDLPRLVFFSSSLVPQSGQWLFETLCGLYSASLPFTSVTSFLVMSRIPRKNGSGLPCPFAIRSSSASQRAVSSGVLSSGATSSISACLCLSDGGFALAVRSYPS